MTAFWIDAAVRFFQPVSSAFDLFTLLLIFALRRGIRNYTARRLGCGRHHFITMVRSAIQEIEVAREIEIQNAAGVNSAAGALISSMISMARTLGAPETVPAENRPSTRRNSPLFPQATASSKPDA